MPTMPSRNSPRVGRFDRFADYVARWTSRAWFFTACVALVILWLPSWFVVNSELAQLLINTPTTIITFLLVALLQNTQKRADTAVQQKLNAIATHLLDDSDETADELRAAIGLEYQESS